MPWTQIHPFFGCFIVHYCFKGNLHSSAVFWAIVWGSIFSDLPRKLYLLLQIFISNLKYNHIYAEWTHSFPISIFLTITGYIIYCYISNKNMTNSLFPCFINNKNQIMSSQKQTMHPHSTSFNKELNENTSLLNNNNDEQIQIISVTTYSSMRSLKTMDHRHNRFEYKYGSSLNCINCWCDLQSFWRLFTYFFLSIFIHCLIDFLFHHSDAHDQFLPFCAQKCNWRSPLSYYEYNYYGYIVGPTLCALTILLSIWIYIHKKEDWKTNSMYYHWFWILLLFVNDCWCSYEVIKPIIVHG